LEMLWRYLCYLGDKPVPQEELCLTLSPPALRKNQDKGGIVKEVVKAASDLQLVVLEDDSVRLSPGVPTNPSGDLRHWLESTLLDPVSANARGQRNIPLAIAWLLEQDPARPLFFSANLAKDIRDWFGRDEDLDLTNAARLQQLAYWAKYMGYAWMLGVGEQQRIVPDPTAAIVRHLPALLPKNHSVPIEQMLANWQEVCPVLESGAAREALLRQRVSPPGRSARDLSASTSLALTRLRERGLLEFEQHADAEPFLFLPDRGRYSHVRLNQIDDDRES